jgi:PX domain
MRAGVLNEKQRPTVKFPEKSLFNTLSPTKVDQRKIALERYLQQLILNPLEHISDICEFLSTDVVQHEASDSVSSIVLIRVSLIGFLHNCFSVFNRCHLIESLLAGIQGRVPYETRQEFWRLETSLFCYSKPPPILL